MVSSGRSWVGLRSCSLGILGLAGTGERSLFLYVLHTHFNDTLKNTLVEFIIICHLEYPWLYRRFIFTRLSTLQYYYLGRMLLYEIALGLEFFNQWFHTSSSFKFRILDQHGISV
jgi:hypothetical protein